MVSVPPEGPPDPEKAGSPKGAIYNVGGPRLGPFRWGKGYDDDGGGEGDACKLWVVASRSSGLFESFS